MAEEIEHRTVAFQVFEHVFAGASGRPVRFPALRRYCYRIAVGGAAQWHYLGFIRRFARTMARGLGRTPRRVRSPAQRSALRRYLRTWSPRYDPARIEMPAGVAEFLARYSALAG